MLAASVARERAAGESLQPVHGKTYDGLCDKAPFDFSEAKPCAERSEGKNQAVPAISFTM